MAEIQDWSKMNATQRIKHAIFRAFVRHIVIGPLVGSFVHKLADSQKLQLKLDDQTSVEVELTDCPTACTNGRTIWYNEGFVMQCSRDALVFLILHEVFHNILSHHVRRGSREPGKWNVAIDGAINQILLGEFFDAGARGDALANKFPNDAISIGIDLPGLVKNYGCDKDVVQDASGERIFENIKKMPQSPGGGGSGKKGKGAGSGIEHQMSEALTKEMMKEEGKSPQEVINEQVGKLLRAVQSAKNAGKLPSTLVMQAEELVEPQVDYRSVLRDFMSKETRGEWSYAMPSRRQSCVDDSIILPGVGTVPGSGVVAVLFDTSGSIYGCKALIDEMMAEVYGIQRDTDSELIVFYVDAAIQKIAHFDASESIRDIAPDDDRLKTVGGGGTDFRCVFEYIEKHGLVLDALVGFTDLAATYPERAPAYPVIWIAHNEGTAPFGKTMNIKPKLVH